MQQRVPIMPPSCLLLTRKRSCNRELTVLLQQTKQVTEHRNQWPQVQIHSLILEKLLLFKTCKRYTEIVKVDGLKILTEQSLRVGIVIPGFRDSRIPRSRKFFNPEIPGFSRTQSRNFGINKIYLFNGLFSTF